MAEPGFVAVCDYLDHDRPPILVHSSGNELLLFGCLRNSRHGWRCDRIDCADTRDWRRIPGGLCFLHDGVFANSSGTSRRNFIDSNSAELCPHSRNLTPVHGWHGILTARPEKSRNRMKCPFCAHLHDKVVDSRESKDGNAIRRRRQCLKCKRRFTSYERIDEIPSMVIKKDGRRERSAPAR